MLISAAQKLHKVHPPQPTSKSMTLKEAPWFFYFHLQVGPLQLPLCPFPPDSTFLRLISLLRSSAVSLLMLITFWFPLSDFALISCHLEICLASLCVMFPQEVHLGWTVLPALSAKLRVPVGSFLP